MQKKVGSVVGHGRGGDQAMRIFSNEMDQKFRGYGGKRGIAETMSMTANTGGTESRGRDVASDLQRKQDVSSQMDEGATEMDLSMRNRGRNGHNDGHENEPVDELPDEIWAAKGARDVQKHYCEGRMSPARWESPSRRWAQPYLENSERMKSTDRMGSVDSKYLQKTGEQRRMEFIQFALVPAGERTTEGKVWYRSWSYGVLIRQIRRWENPEEKPTRAWGYFELADIDYNSPPQREVGEICRPPGKCISSSGLCSRSNTQER
ncbi:hypothetical protein B0H11DRAFT_1915871 [Mycena galericulata]|nr:hypothetical protein B0H11DRAFT_1915871 [Mycena galericulata]